MILLTHLLSTTPQSHLDTWHMDALTTQLTLQVTSTQALVHCPICRFPTQRVRSRYIRTVTDLPWASWRVGLHLQVRKFFSINGRCPRRIFTERLWPLVAPWARRTQRLRHWLTHITMARGGRAGGRLSCPLGLAINRHMLLRLLRRLPRPGVAMPHVLGVDDWASRKRQASGTARLSLRPSASRRCRGLTARWLCQCHLHPRRAWLRSWPSNVRHCGTMARGG